MQLFKGFFGQFASRTGHVEVLDELHKLGVDIFGIDRTRTCFCDIGVNRIVKIISFRTSPSITLKQFPVSLQQNKVSLFVQFHLDIGIGITMLELIFILIPCESLQLGCFQQMGHLAEIFGKHIPVFSCFRQFCKILNFLCLEYIPYVQELLVDICQITFQFIDKNAQRSVHIYIECIIDILLHGVRERVIADNAERLVWTKQAVGT